MVKQLLSSKEQAQVIQTKAKEIQKEFFQTYLKSKDTQDPVERKKLLSKVPWSEHMTVTSDDKILIDPTLGPEEVQREVQIYEITMANVQRAIAYLTQEGIPVQKPEDYEVEMFKSPKQMDKIKNKVIQKQDAKKKKEEHRMKQQNRKLMKQMKVKKLRFEQSEKKLNQRAIEEWKKNIKEKGSEKAGDLNDYVNQQREQLNKSQMKTKRDKDEGSQKKFGRKSALSKFKSHGNRGDSQGRPNKREFKPRHNRENTGNRGFERSSSRGRGDSQGRGGRGRGRGRGLGRDGQSPFRGSSKFQSRSPSNGFQRDRSDGFARGQSRGLQRDQPRGFARGHSRGHSTGHSRGHSRGSSRGDSRSHSRGPSRGHSRGYSMGGSRGQSRGQSRGHSRGPSRGHSRGPSRGNSRGPSRGRSRGGRR